MITEETHPELNYCKAKDRFVLLLTQAYTPLGITTAREGIYKLIRCVQHSNPSVYALSRDGNQVSWNDWVDPELAELYLHDDQPYLTTAHRSYPVPTILLTTGKFYFRSGKAKQPRLKVLYSHYKGKCQICGEKKPLKVMTLEHIMPKAKHGTNDSFNVTMTCQTCNSMKGDIYPYFNWEGQELQGYNPSHLPDIDLVRKEWKPYAFK